MTPPVSPFPPSFDGNPWTYAFALFSLTLVSALSLAQLLEYAFEEQRKREIDRLVHNQVAAAPIPSEPINTLTAFRRIVISFLLMAFLGATPDVLILLAWGETSIGWMERLYLLDRVCDGLVMFPFMTAMWLLARTRQAMPQQLAKAALIPLGPFHWGMLRQRLRIVVLVLFIAAGVTLGKASV
jgi:hypothetical protein